MCGVFGIVALRNTNVKRIILRQILKNLTQFSQSRGRDATGYAFSSKNEIRLFKHNIKADDFIKLANYREVVRTELASKNFYSVIGHTRAQTKGSPTDPNNNHPIKVGNIIGVHNGVIMNDDNLFELLSKYTKGEVSRIAQVDSEIIFSLINYYSTKNKFPASIKGVKLIGHIADPTSQAIMKAVGMLEGSFVCAILDVQNPKATWIFKGVGKLTMKHFVREGLIIYASEKEFIDEAVHVFNFERPETIEIAEQSGICINAETNAFSRFTLKQARYVNRTW